MNKILKRLLTGVLTLATVFTALPTTAVYAADSVYTTTEGKAGTIVKVDNGGSEVSSFEESIMNADGQIAYCSRTGNRSSNQHYMCMVSKRL